jgi:hypothetical protein
VKIVAIRRVFFALAPAVGAAWLAAQSTSTSSPAARPTNPVPDVALTPGSAALTPGPSSTSSSTSSSPATTPGRNNDIYSIPNATPVGMPSHVTPSTTGSTGHPTSAADCAGNGWRGYSALGFQSQKNCEDWLSQHPAGRLTPQTGASKPSRVTAPSRRTTPRHPSSPPVQPGMESTPGSSITPLLNPTPAS